MPSPSSNSGSRTPAARPTAPGRRRARRVSCADDDRARRAARGPARGRGCPASRRWSGTTCAAPRTPRRPAPRRARTASAAGPGRCRGCPAARPSPARCRRSRGAGPGRRPRRPCGRGRGSARARGRRTRRRRPGRAPSAARSRRARRPASRRRPRAGRLAQQLGADEAVEVAVEDALGVAHLEVRAVVLDHRVRVQHVGADLRAEVHVLRLALLARRAPPGARAPARSSSLARSIFIAVSRLLADCERSFWHCTTMPVGRWVMRTAESVLLTCWPPAPEAR